MVTLENMTCGALKNVCSTFTRFKSKSLNNALEQINVDKLLGFLVTKNRKTKTIISPRISKNQKTSRHRVHLADFKKVMA